MWQPELIGSDEGEGSQEYYDERDKRQEHVYYYQLHLHSHSDVLWDGLFVLDGDVAFVLVVCAVGPVAFVEIVDVCYLFFVDVAVPSLLSFELDNFCV